MLQAAVCNGGKFDASTFGKDCLCSSKVDIRRREVVDTLMVADVIIVFDEDVDLPFEVARQIVVVE